MVALRVFILSLMLGPLPVALVFLAVTSAPLPSLGPVLLGSILSIYVGTRAPMLIGQALAAQQPGMVAAQPFLLKCFDRARDTLRQARRQKGLVAEFSERPESIRIMTFRSARALVFPTRSLFFSKKIIFVSTGAASTLSEAALSESLARALVAMEAPNLPARCWAAVLMNFLNRLLPADAVETLAAFESSLDGAPILRPLAQQRPSGTSIVEVISFWILSPWLAKLLRITRAVETIPSDELGLREAFVSHVAMSGAGVDSERFGRLNSRLGQHVPVAIDGLVRGL